MSVKMREKVELEIATAVIAAVLGAGYKISVDNGDNSGNEYELGHSEDQAAILKAMFQTDDERLYVENANGKAFGWVFFVYGNDGWDVISDYTVNLESLVGDGTAVQKIVDSYAD